MKKAALSTMTIFYVFMGLVFVWILFYGIDKLSGLTDQISEQERVEIKAEIQDIFEYCEDPLNKGAKRTVSFNHKAFNAVCIVGTDIDIIPNEGFREELEILSSTFGPEETPVVLLSTTYESTDTGYTISEVNIVDSFDINLREKQRDTTCWFDSDNNFEKVEIVALC